MKTPFKMKGSPMQRNFGIGSPLNNGQKTKKKLKKTLIGPIEPMVDENKNNIPDYVESIESKEGRISKPKVNSTKTKKNKSNGGTKGTKSLKTKNSTPPTSKGKRKPVDPIIQIPTHSRMGQGGPGFGLDR